MKLLWNTTLYRSPLKLLASKWWTDIKINNSLVQFMSQIQYRGGSTLYVYTGRSIKRGTKWNCYCCYKNRNFQQNLSHKICEIFWTFRLNLVGDDMFDQLASPMNVCCFEIVHNSLQHINRVSPFFSFDIFFLNLPFVPGLSPYSPWSILRESSPVGSDWERRAAMNYRSSLRLLGHLVSTTVKTVKWSTVLLKYSCLNVKTLNTFSPSMLEWNISKALQCIGLHSL